MTALILRHTAVALIIFGLLIVYASYEPASQHSRSTAFAEDRG